MTQDERSRLAALEAAALKVKEAWHMHCDCYNCIHVGPARRVCGPCSDSIDAACASIAALVGEE